MYEEVGLLSSGIWEVLANTVFAVSQAECVLSHNSLLIVRCALLSSPFYTRL
jgi:hypothetical protein